ncbi:MAG: TonB-dependent receptor [Sphingomonadales bacterium]|nr:TonB-dependent receptor [Sphingomonadales bacterium]
MRKIGSRNAISVSFLAVATALAAPAMAQDAPASAANSADSNDANQIVVTGSLIQRPNNTAVSPIVSVSDAAIKESGKAELVDALNQLPGFTVGGNEATGGQGTGGRATINLHGLGTNRNLVLLDGRRLPASDIRGNVDINILPDAIIGGVDAITGGASAVYGSDAMSGVVNFKTVRSLQGIVADAQSAISARGDAFKFKGSVAFGSSFAQDRGHVIAAFSYTKQDPLNGNQRPFFFSRTPSGFIGTGTYVPSASNAPSGAVLTALFNSYGVAGARNPLASNLGFNNDGTLFTQTGALNYKGPDGTGGYAVVGGNVRMPVGQQIDYINGLNRKTAFLKADYEITPDIQLYGQFMFVDLTTSTHSGGSLTQFGTLTSIPVTNPFIPTDLRTVLASRPNPTANFNWSARYVGVPYKGWDEDYTIQQYLGGIKGNIASGWTFDGFVSYDESKHESVMHNAVLKSRVQTLLNAADGGASICAGGFNPFGDANARSLSQACQAYITKDAVSRERLTQTQAQFQINGKLFDLGAGPAQLALVADWRKNTYAYAPDSDVTSLSGFAPGGNVEAFVVQLPVPEKSISVKEFAGQIDVPLISDKPMFKELAIGAAARVSDYSVSGAVTSYEADARWRPTENLLFRGSYQRAVRAPNIAELFSPPQGSQLAIGTPPAALGDPCDSRSTARTGANAAQVAALCVAQGIPAASIATYQFQTTATGQLTPGSTAITPEKADTFNAGFVFNAPRGSGILGDFSLSVDYYDIKIKNVISPVPGLTVLSGCYNLDGSNPTYSATDANCKLIQRDANGQLVSVTTPYQNLGSLKTDGIEIQVHWGIPARFLSESGKLYIDSAIGYLNHYKVQLLPGGAFLDYTGISNGSASEGSVPPRATPRWKGLTTFGYRSDVFSMGLRWKYQNALADVSKVNTPTNVAIGVPAYATWDAFASVKINSTFELRGGINNLFDKGLPFVASNQTSTDTALYDVIGRAFYIGAKVKF